MTLNHLLRFHALLAAIYGIGLIALPRVIVGLLSTAALGSVGGEICRLFGAALLQIAITAWATSRMEDQVTRRVFTRGLFGYTALGTLLSLAGQLHGIWSVLGWTTVLSYFILALGYAYFLVAQPR